MQRRKDAKPQASGKPHAAAFASGRTGQNQDKTTNLQTKNKETMEKKGNNIGIIALAITSILSLVTIISELREEKDDEEETY